MSPSPSMPSSPAIPQSLMALVMFAANSACNIIWYAVTSAQNVSCCANVSSSTAAGSAESDEENSPTDEESSESHPTTLTIAIRPKTTNFFIIFSFQEP